MVLIYMTPEKIEEALLNRFRPLAGIMVLIGCFEEATYYDMDECFRPLAGIMVLITA